jgi:membrane protein required for colicin V production
MCWVDIVILILIVGLVIQGLISGFIRGIFDLAGIILGIFLALEYAERLRMTRFLAFLLIFIGTVLVVSIAGRIISKLIHLTPLGVFDRLMGGALGLVKAIFFCFVFLLLLFLLNKQSVIKGCEIAPIILKTGISASQMLPEKWYKWIKKLTIQKEKEVVVPSVLPLIKIG